MSEQTDDLCRVLIIDDHPLIRRGMASLIRQEVDMDVCGESDEMDDALRLVNELQPDLAIVDISLKSGTGIELVKQVKARHGDAVRLLVCSMHDESLFAERCYRAGAMGFVNKEEATEKVIDAIRLIMSGKMYVSDDLSERLLNRALGSEGPAEVSPIESLTDRELEVFGLIGRGLMTRQIADQLHLSHKTIETYRENIKAKLGLANAAELNRHAVQFALERHS